jgi:hypothetical protein
MKITQIRIETVHRMPLAGEVADEGKLTVEKRFYFVSFEHPESGLVGSVQLADSDAAQLMQKAEQVAIRALNRLVDVE